VFGSPLKTAWATRDLPILRSAFKRVLSVGLADDLERAGRVKRESVDLERAG
jgi:hypothetical protein